MCARFSTEYSILSHSFQSIACFAHEHPWGKARARFVACCKGRKDGESSCVDDEASRKAHAGTVSPFLIKITYGIHVWLVLNPAFVYTAKRLTASFARNIKLSVSVAKMQLWLWR